MIKIKKMLLLYFIVICMELSGCGSSGEMETENHGIEEQVTNSEEINNITEKFADANTDANTADGEDAVNQEGYIEVDIADLAARVRYFSYGKGWYFDDSSEVWKCTDTEGNILFSLPFGWEPKNGFIHNYCMIQHESYKDKVIDQSGNQVFGDVVSDEKDILLLSENNDVVNLWVRTIRDAYDGHSETLSVIDENGTILSEYTSLEGVSLGYIREIKDLGDGMYQCGGYVFNINNNSYFRYEDSAGLIADILNFNHGYGIGEDGRVIDLNGTVCFSGPAGVVVGKYGNDVFFMGHREEIYASGKYYDTFRGAFYNAEGQMEIDISQYSLMRIPFYKDNFCILEILNEAGVRFTSVIDKSGEFLFEPIKGCIISSAGYEYDNFYVSDGVVVIKGDDTQICNLEQKSISIWPDDLIGIGAFHDGWAAFDMGSRNMAGFIDKDGNHLKVKLPLNSVDS